MWRRKTDAELADLQNAKGRRRLNPFVPLLIALVSAVVASLYVQSVIWEFAIIFFVVTFLLAYIAQMIPNGFIYLLALYLEAAIPTKDSIRICEHCHLFQYRAKQCAKCGGRLEHPDYWKWVAEEEATDHGHPEETPSCENRPA